MGHVTLWSFELLISLSIERYHPVSVSNQMEIWISNTPIGNALDVSNFHFSHTFILYQTKKSQFK